jgi:hypothetical protein
MPRPESAKVPDQLKASPSDVSEGLNQGPSRSFNSLAQCWNTLWRAKALRSWASERAPLRLVVIRWTLLIIGLCSTAAVWIGGSAPDNLARNGSVTMSSNCDILPDYSPFPAEASRLVDGKTDRGYDACTAKGRAPWIRVDLGLRAVVNRIVLVGRADCCWAADTLPLVVEVSEDGKEFTEIQRRTLPFTRDDPWTILLEQRIARIVRLRVDSPSNRSQIVLTEIEVYGHPNEDR